MFKRFSTIEVMLLLNGLRATYVADQVKVHNKLSKALEAELASRGVSLKE